MLLFSENIVFLLSIVWVERSEHALILKQTMEMSFSFV